MGRQRGRCDLILGLLGLGLAACADEQAVPTQSTQAADGKLHGSRPTDVGDDTERASEPPPSQAVQQPPSEEPAPRQPEIDGDVVCDAAAMPKALPEARFDLTAAALPDGRIFLIGGASAYAVEPSALALGIYDPRDGSYRALRSASFVPQGVPAASFVRGWLVVSAGEVARYSLSEDRWYSGARPSRTLLNRAAAVGADGRVYFFGGLNDGGIMTPFADAYDPETDSWTTLPDMPFPVNGAAAVHVDGQFYVVGPRAAVFDAQESAWRTAATPLTPRYWLGAAVDTAGRILAIGGYPAGGVGASAAVEVYDPPTNRWSADGTLDVPVMSMATAAACGGIYLLGGSTLGGAVATVQRLDSAGWSVSQ